MCCACDLHDSIGVSGRELSVPATWTDHSVDLLGLRREPLRENFSLGDESALKSERPTQPANRTDQIGFKVFVAQNPIAIWPCLD